MPAKLQPIDSTEILAFIDNQTDNQSSVPEGFTHERVNFIAPGWSKSRAPVSVVQITDWRSSQPGAAIRSIHCSLPRSRVRDSRSNRPDPAKGQTSELPVHLYPGMSRKRAFPLSSGEVIEAREIITPEELAEQGATPDVTDQPLSVLDDIFFISGENPCVTDYKFGFPGHLRRPEDGTGWEGDPPLMEERYVAANIADEGLLVFSACSHAGIVNVLHAAPRGFPGVPIRGLTGGFHLAGGNEKVIDRAVADYAQFDIN